MCRYILKYFILREKYAQADVDDFLKTASEKGKRHFTEHYKSQPLLIQCVYVNLLTEAWRRIQSGHDEPYCTSYDIIEAKKDKIVKRLKTTDDEFLRDRFFPMISAKKQARYKDFIKKYKR